MTATLTVAIDNSPDLETKRASVVSALEKLIDDISDQTDSDINRLLMTPNISVGIITDEMITSSIARTLKELKLGAGGQ